MRSSVGSRPKYCPIASQQAELLKPCIFGERILRQLTHAVIHAFEERAAGHFSQHALGFLLHDAIRGVDAHAVEVGRDSALGFGD
jgi:hypothetical protein